MKVYDTTRVVICNSPDRPSDIVALEDLTEVSQECSYFIELPHYLLSKLMSGVANRSKLVDERDLLHKRIIEIDRELSESTSLYLEA